MFLIPCLLALVIVIITHFQRKRRIQRSIKKLPPGSMGFPLIGESIQFFSPYKLYEIPPFIQKRVARYGPVFRTRLVGQRVIVSTDSEINYTIFQLEDKSFKCWYSESFIKIFGEESPVGHHGTFHKYLKNIILHLISPENLRKNLLHEMDELTRENLRSWTKESSVDVKEKVANGRKNAVNVIKGVLNHRRSSNTIGGDYMDYLLMEMKKEKPLLSEQMAIDLVFALLFAAYETTSASITLLMKFLTDHQLVVDKLREEHEEILKNRKAENSDSGISWREYRSMNLTHTVINETVRLANIVPGIFRKVLEDVEIKGYTFPAGWVVMTTPQTLHLDPAEYKDPLVFNPWRWKGQELHAGSKTFMAFGGGVRLCVGADFAKLQMAIFIHYLVINYRSAAKKKALLEEEPTYMLPRPPGFEDLTPLELKEIEISWLRVDLKCAQTEVRRFKQYWEEEGVAHFEAEQKCKSQSHALKQVEIGISHLIREKECLQELLAKKEADVGGNSKF